MSAAQILQIAALNDDLAQVEAARDAALARVRELEEVLRWRVYPAETPSDQQWVEFVVPVPLRSVGRDIGRFTVLECGYSVLGDYEVGVAGGWLSFQWRPLTPGPE